MKFWDSSALVPLLVRQTTSRKLRSLYRADTAVVAWWGSRVECESAISRLERERHLTARVALSARRRLDLFAAAWQEVQPVDALRDRARRLLRVHDLRAADALQLAAALVAAEQHPSSLPLVCLDTNLTAAASREGFPVVGASSTPQHGQHWR